MSSWTVNQFPVRVRVNVSSLPGFPSALTEGRTGTRRRKETLKDTVKEGWREAVLADPPHYIMLPWEMLLLLGLRGVMTSQEDASSFTRFFQYVEDSGLRTYDGLVIQNASDIARESDRIRNQTNWNYLQEKHQKKRRQEDAIQR
ncbi:hypothetical protein FQN60_005367 [Etheostoma spectabile]|uniref:Uncharacterized protein n=1 Tax=Etheostoma spectabile TaxID=54343 RepID=A0A5J5CDQ6_9PERO|nr:hypothetical protein FQN60_005367 [Etheostoma spectabile]